MKDQIKSIKFAINGLKTATIEEPNFRVHLVISLIVISSGIILSISKMEWLMIFLTIGSVLISELFNTAIENICNYMTPDQDRKIGIIKDISAGAVLVSALAALVIGLIIFIPYIIKILP